ncbi:MAG: hypothetical protein ACFFAO_08550 [Candidatus Hermodarchaeota archaeon]
MPSWEKDKLKGKELYRGGEHFYQAATIPMCISLFLIYLIFAVNNIICTIISLLIILLFIIELFLMHHSRFIRIYEDGIVIRWPIPIIHFFPKIYPWDRVIGSKIIKYIECDLNKSYSRRTHRNRKMLIIFFTNQKSYEIKDSWISGFAKIQKLIQKYKKAEGLIPEKIAYCPSCGGDLKKNLCWHCGTKVVQP